MVADLPEFDAPPVIEVALDLQFRPIPELHGLRLAPLREVWRADLPQLQEQTPLAPVIEGETLPRIEFLTGPPQPRYWFVSEDGSELVQLQLDRLAVNWRAVTGAEYPRYPAVRAMLRQRVDEFQSFLHQEGLREVEVVQAEIAYVNAIEMPSGELGMVGHALRTWAGLPGHHLGEPGEARLNLAFDVPNLGKPPVRLYVAVNPGQHPDGSKALFLNLTIRGNPGATDVDEALNFIDGGHEHIVQSFAELTTDSLHELWRRRT